MHTIDKSVRHYLEDYKSFLLKEGNMKTQGSILFAKKIKSVGSL